jgi:hypothetical protein
MVLSLVRVLFSGFAPGTLPGAESGAFLLCELRIDEPRQAHPAGSLRSSISLRSVAERSADGDNTANLYQTLGLCCAHQA